jgi:hypothetical protein
MDPILIVVLPGVIGGLIVAAVLYALHQRTSETVAPLERDGLPSTDVINAARIRVAGIGGLGLLAMAATVAWQLPRIGQTVAVGAILGLVLAAALIARRRSSGAMPSSGQRPGANTVLAIDQPDTLEQPERDVDHDARPRTRTRAEALSASAG